jgi:hypothetical protein
VVKVMKLSFSQGRVLSPPAARLLRQIVADFSALMTGE